VSAPQSIVERAEKVLRAAISDPHRHAFTAEALNKLDAEGSR
jgi:hypothetical protein